jgi:hypothetical protein
MRWGGEAEWAVGAPSSSRRFRRAKRAAPMSENPNRVRLDEADWGEIHARLLAFATFRCRPDGALARDLVQGAITSVYAHDSKWNPEKDPDLLRYLMSVVNSQLANERARASATRTSSMSAPRTLSAAHRVGDAQAFSEEKAEEHDLLHRRMTLLRERLAGDPEALRLVELLLEGVDSPTELRRLTGWSAEVVLAARRRMLRCAAGVARAIGAPEDGPDTLAAEDDDGGEDDDEEEVA